MFYIYAECFEKREKLVFAYSVPFVEKKRCVKFANKIVVLAKQLQLADVSGEICK